MVVGGLVAGWMASTDARATVPTETTEPGRRFVLGATLGLNVGVFPIPSGELSLFLGGAPARRLRRPHHWIAIGYKGAIAAGSRRAATQTRAVSPAPPVRDADGDGVGDAYDRCPLVGGPKAWRGCPEVDRDEEGTIEAPAQAGRVLSTAQAT